MYFRCSFQPACLFTRHTVLKNLISSRLQTFVHFDITKTTSFVYSVVCNYSTCNACFCLLCMCIIEVYNFFFSDLCENTNPSLLPQNRKQLYYVEEIIVQINCFPDCKFLGLVLDRFLLTSLIPTLNFITGHNLYTNIT